VDLYESPRLAVPDVVFRKTDEEEHGDRVHRTLLRRRASLRNADPGSDRDADAGCNRIACVAQRTTACHADARTNGNADTGADAHAVTDTRSDATGACKGPESADRDAAMHSASDTNAVANGNADAFAGTAFGEPKHTVAAGNVPAKRSAVTDCSRVTDNRCVADSVAGCNAAARGITLAVSESETFVIDSA
jgi:hypothetical protein